MDDVKQLRRWRYRLRVIRALRDRPESVRGECDRQIEALTKRIEKGGEK